jgi:hypothetical protein
VITKLAVFTVGARFLCTFSDMYRAYHCCISGKIVISSLCGDAPRPGPEGPGLRHDLGQPRLTARLARQRRRRHVVALARPVETRSSHSAVDHAPCRAGAALRPRSVTSPMPGQPLSGSACQSALEGKGGRSTRGMPYAITPARQHHSTQTTWHRPVPPLQRSGCSPPLAAGHAGAHID